MIKVLFILLISPAIAFCDDGIVLGLGKQSHTRYSLIFGDYAAFDQQTRDDIGGYVWKYGIGHTHIQIGNNYGVNLSANTGIGVGGVPADKDNGIMPFVGLEAFNGQIQANVVRQVQDFYQGFMMPSAGVQVSLEKCRALGLVKAGGTAGTLGKNGILPSFNLAYGYGGFMNCGDFIAGYGTTLTPHKSLHDTTVFVNFTEKFGIGANYQDVKGVRNESNAIGFARFRY